MKHAADKSLSNMKKHAAVMCPNTTTPANVNTVRNINTSVSANTFHSTTTSTRHLAVKAGCKGLAINAISLEYSHSFTTEISEPREGSEIFIHFVPVPDVTFSLSFLSLSDLQHSFRARARLRARARWFVITAKATYASG
jgi:hypothetical protein